MSDGGYAVTMIDDPSGRSDAGAEAGGRAGRAPARGTRPGWSALVSLAFGATVWALVGLAAPPAGAAAMAALAALFLYLSLHEERLDADVTRIRA